MSYLNSRSGFTALELVIASALTLVAVAITGAAVSKLTEWKADVTAQDLVVSEAAELADNFILDFESRMPSVFEQQDPYLSFDTFCTGLNGWCHKFLVRKIDPSTSTFSTTLIETQCRALPANLGSQITIPKRFHKCSEQEIPIVTIRTVDRLLNVLTATPTIKERSVPKTKDTNLIGFYVLAKPIFPVRDPVDNASYTQIKSETDNGVTAEDLSYKGVPKYWTQRNPLYTTGLALRFVAYRKDKDEKVSAIVLKRFLPVPRRRTGADIREISSVDDSYFALGEPITGGGILANAPIPGGEASDPLPILGGGASGLPANNDPPCPVDADECPQSGGTGSIDTGGDDEGVNDGDEPNSTQGSRNPAWSQYTGKFNAAISIDKFVGRKEVNFSFDE